MFYFFVCQTSYPEQPGLQPHIPDVEVVKFSSYDNATAQLLCLAKQVGEWGQVTADGFLANRRHHMAMGLAAIQIAQYTQVRFVLKENKFSFYFNVLCN